MNIMPTRQKVELINKYKKKEKDVTEIEKI